MVASSLADNLMRLVAEGAGEGDEEADAELRSRAAASYLQLLAKPKLPNILLKVALPLLHATHAAVVLLKNVADSVRAGGLAVTGLPANTFGRADEGCHLTVLDASA